MLECKTHITQYDSNGERHGYWEHYFNNGNLMCKGTYHHGEYIGYWEWYHTNGKVWFKNYYARI